MWMHVHTGLAYVHVNPCVMHVCDMYIHMLCACKQACAWYMWCVYMQDHTHVCPCSMQVCMYCTCVCMCVCVWGVCAYVYVCLCKCVCVCVLWSQEQREFLDIGSGNLTAFLYLAVFWHCLKQKLYCLRATNCTDHILLSGFLMNLLWHTQ